MNLQEKIEALLKQALNNLTAAVEERMLNDLRTAIMGKKGELTEILKGIKT